MARKSYEIQRELQQMMRTRESYARGNLRTDNWDARIAALQAELNAAMIAEALKK